MTDSRIRRFVKSQLVRRGAPSLLLGVLLGAGAQAEQMVETLDATESRAFDIPASDLAHALDMLGAQSGLQILYEPEIAADRRAPALEGRMTVREALTRLLGRRDVEWVFADDKVIVVRKARTAQTATPMRMALSDAVEGAQAATTPSEPADASLEEVVVTGNKIFNQSDAYGATKMGLAVKDTPQTVSIVTEDLMKVAAMQTFKDFYKVDASTGASHVLDSYPRNYFRGFGGSQQVRLDGFRIPGYVELDLGILDRFEVVKGATSTLYGQNPIAGMLNAVSKLPQERFGSQISLEMGSFDDRRVDADVTGPFGSSQQWSYRMIGAYRDAGSFVDMSSYRRTLLAPSVRFSPSEATTIFLRGIYQKDDDHYAWAPALQYGGDGSELDPDDPDVVDNYMLTRVQREGLRYLDVPRSRYFGMPWNGTDKEAKFLQLQAEHRFDNEWKLRANLQCNSIKTTLNQYVMGGPFDEDGFAYFSSAYSTVTDSNYYGGEVNLFGDVSLFGREHTVFLGFDYADTRDEWRLGFEPIFEPFNAFDPDYSAVPALRSPDDYFYYVSDNDEHQATYGATVQLIFHPTDRASILLGGRYSKAKFTVRNRAAESADAVEGVDFSSATYHFEKVVGQAGLTYRLTDTINLYASYGETFEPGTARVWVEDDPSGKLIEPELGKAYEVGLKGQLDDTLSFSVAAFDMKRANIAQGDRDHPGFSLALGTQASKGIELNLQGRVLPPLSLSVSAAWLDAKFDKGEFSGLQPPNAPKFGLSAYGTYEILQGPVKGLGFALGVVHKRGLKGFDTTLTRSAMDRGDAPVIFDFGDFTELDVQAFYETPRWALSLGVTNLLDEKYYSQTFSNLRYGINPNPPTAVQGRVTLKF